jgi:hypothetical protein
MPLVELNGLFRPDFVTDRCVPVKMGEQVDGAPASNAARWTEIRDARHFTIQGRPRDDSSSSTASSSCAMTPL